MQQTIMASVTDRGQVTIPAEVRKLLGIKARDKVNFVIEDGEITLRRPKYTLETAYASVPPLPDGKDIDQAIREAKEDRADRLIEKMRKGKA
jgi:AbrB family looped-hinge helix DNA binding protein